MKKTENKDFPKESFTRKLSDRDRDIFLKMLEEPAEPNEALRKAAEEYKKRIKDKTIVSDNDSKFWRI